METKNEDDQQPIAPKSPKKKNKGLNRQKAISGPSIERQGSSFDKLFEETKGSFEIIEEYENVQQPTAPKSPKKTLFSSYCKSSFHCNNFPDSVILSLFSKIIKKYGPDNVQVNCS